MARNQCFAPNQEPFKDDKLQLIASSADGPFSLLNPTQASFRHPEVAAKPADHNNGTETSTSRATSPSTEKITFQWRSRDNRKGRHALRVQAQTTKPDDAVQGPTPTSTPSEILTNVKRMATVFRPWDISWLVAQIFLWGSVVWVLNAFFVLLPLTNPSSEFPGEILYGGGITAFVGAILFFETGSVLLVLEAVNENRAGCFGWELVKVLEEGEEEVWRSRARVLGLRPGGRGCTHHHADKGNLVGGGHGVEDGKSWRWFPSWRELKTHYLRELGFLACLAQLFGATVFGISGITALPGIIDNMDQPLLNIFYWVPQIVGGSGFIASGLLFMLETQKKWYVPAFDVLGWHIGLWNLIGAFGFTLCGSLGPAANNSGAQFEASLATTWGSFAFLIASVLQLYEAVQKHPVESVHS